MADEKSECWGFVREVQKDSFTRSFEVLVYYGWDIPECRTALEALTGPQGRISSEVVFVCSCLVQGVSLHFPVACCPDSGGLSANNAGEGAGPVGRSPVLALDSERIRE